MTLKSAVVAQETRNHIKHPLGFSITFLRDAINYYFQQNAFSQV